MGTYRERREARAERLREWSAAREAKQGALNEAARGDEAATGIPFGQPILVGHHSERRHRAAIARVDRAMGAAVENSRKAESMASRAENIEAQAAQAIYTDDHDAKERLTEKIAALEAERDRIKAYNASCRKAAKTGGVGDTSLLSDAERRELAATARACAYMLGAGGAMPRYKLTNLSANIGRLKKRLAGLDAARERQQVGRIITARYGGSCAECGASIERGQQIRYSKAAGARCATACGEEEG
jgi:hypothetical protein